MQHHTKTVKNVFKALVTATAAMCKSAHDWIKIATLIYQLESFEWCWGALGNLEGRVRAELPNLKNGKMIKFPSKLAKIQWKNAEFLEITEKWYSVTEGEKAP